MPLEPILFKPGVDKETTDYVAEGGWVDSNKIRFRKGLVERVGGWIALTAEVFVGVCRSLHTWSDLGSAIRTGLGTHLKYELEEGGLIYDITPIRKTTNPLANDPILTGAIGSGIITITDTGHGATVGSYITLSGATTVDGILDTEINAEHVITEILTGNTYTVDTGGSATAGAVNGGGAAIVAAYQINVGLVDFVAGQGWGAGTWSDDGGAQGWGDPSAAIAGGQQMRLWSEDNFGEDLVINPRGGEIYYWDRTNGTSTRAVALSTLVGASDTPTHANIISVTENRQVMAYGVNDIGTSIQDPMLIRWCDEESIANWTPEVDNGAGGFRLGVGSLIIASEKGRQETLVWTDKAVYAQRLGGEFIWTHPLLTINVSIISPKAAILVDQVMHWMDRGNFYKYGGRVEILPCSQLAYVFEDFNYDQAFKVTVGRNSEFGEITWWYPSGGSSENDRYITYNYKENIWYGGTIERTAWEESRLRSKPIAVDSNGIIYSHEVGDSDNGSDLTCYAESADLDLGDGDVYWFINRILPDLKLKTGAEVTITIKGRDYPLNNKETQEIFTVDATTGKNDVRLRARQIAIRVESVGQKAGWRLGRIRIGWRPDGRRRAA